MRLDNPFTLVHDDTSRSLSIGETVEPVSMDNPVTVLATRLVAPAGNGTYAWWLVLCHLPHNERHPFAVWNAYDRPEGWSFGNGDYRATLGEAWQAYTDRGGQ